ncbi:MAG: HPP family protein [Gammaproteobacteria bacterium]|nr:HPP family protein [Gammaproteobacteria bacterium]
MQAVHWSTKLLHWWGIEFSPVSHAERIISAIGGFCGILFILLISTECTRSLGVQAQVLIVASMGASAVLLFAVPHGALSQPWSLVGGHLLSALIGVACQQFISQPIFAAAIAVGCAIAAMHYARCLHPPGGATALSAVIGGETVHALGWQYVLFPIGVNVVVILIVALLVNAPFAWRRYPAAWARKTKINTPPQTQFTHGDFAWALRQIDSFIDVSEDDLAQIFALANQHAQMTPLDTSLIEVGGFYSNGRLGDDWAVRRVLSETMTADDAHQLDYQVVAGRDRGNNNVQCTRDEFANWARYAVIANGDKWQRLTSNI